MTKPLTSKNDLVNGWLVCFFAWMLCDVATKKAFATRFVMIMVVDNFTLPQKLVAGP